MRLLHLLIGIAALALATRAAAQVPLPAATRVELEADRLIWEGEGLVRAEGTVRLRAGRLRLSADEVRYDSSRALAELGGGVTVLDGDYVARAERARFDLASGTGVLENVLLLDKEAPPPPELVFGADAAALTALGRNELVVRADSVGRGADGSWFAESPEVTTCDCGGDPPPWTIGASRATVTPGESVGFAWPVLRARGVPIAALPYLSLPLSDRKTGFLAPELGYSGNRGFSYGQPFFLVLGRSYDLTLTPAWFFGRSRDVDGVELDRGFRGPRLSSELRYVPRAGTAGRAFVAWAYDLSNRIDEPERFDPTGATRLDERNRFAIRLEHADDWGGGLSDRVALNLVSDRLYVRDFTDDVRRRNNQALVSTAWLAQREGAGLLALEGAYFQDLRPRFPGGEVPAGTQPESLGLLGDVRNTFARLPALDADLARLRLPGGAGLSLHAGVARFAPFGDPGFGDEGRDGLGPGDPEYRAPDAGEGDGVVGEGERRAALRLALRPTLTAPLVLPPFASLTPYVGWREQLYLYDGTGDDGHQGYGVAGAELRTELARTFGSGLRHAIVPSLELRHLFPGGRAHAPEAPYDERDLFPARATTQARGLLATRVDGAAFSFDAAIGQGLALDPAELAETFAEASFSVSPFRASGELRWDADTLALREAAADATLSDRRGDQLRLGYRKIGPDGSLRLLAAPDELFAASRRPAWLAPLAIEQVSAGASVVPARGLTLRYDLLFLPTLDSARLLQQRAGVGYVSSCDCWGAGVSVLYRRGGVWSFDLGLDLGGLVEI